MATMDLHINLSDEEGVAQAIEMLSCYLNGSRVRLCQKKYFPGGVAGRETDKKVTPLDDELDNIDVPGEGPMMERDEVAPTGDELAEGGGMPVELPPDASLELDSAGMPWDAEKHSSQRTKLANGTWRPRRNSKSKDKPIPGPPSDKGLTPEEMSFKNMMDVLKGKGLSVPQMNELAVQVGVDSIALLVSKPELIPAVLALAGKDDN